MSKLVLLCCVTLVTLVSSDRLEPEFLSSNARSYAYAHASAEASAYNGAYQYENVNNGDGIYRFSYDSPTGISVHEHGAPRAGGPEGAAVTAEGGYSFRALDGQQYSITYTADENGFHPVGSHLPTPPPIPEEILRSIEFNRQHPSSDEGSYNGAGNAYNY